jgi:hypothetical protein
MSSVAEMDPLAGGSKCATEPVTRSTTSPRDDLASAIHMRAPTCALTPIAAMSATPLRRRNPKPAIGRPHRFARCRAATRGHMGRARLGVMHSCSTGRAPRTARQSDGSCAPGRTQHGAPASLTVSAFATRSHGSAPAKRAPERLGASASQMDSPGGSISRPCCRRSRCRRIRAMSAVPTPGTAASMPGQTIASRRSASSTPIGSSSRRSSR